MIRLPCHTNNPDEALRTEKKDESRPRKSGPLDAAEVATV
jgi:hypothetical protein